MMTQRKTCKAAPKMTASLRGLSSADAARRLSESGPNALPPPKRPPWWKRFVAQFKSALIYLLLFALVVDLASWLHAGASGVPIEALAVAAILLLNAGLGLLQEYRSERALEELARLGAPKAWVMRDGVLTHSNVASLVVGDVIRLEAGDRVPADGRAENATFMRVDESLLTGESVPIEKGEGDELLSGTLLVQGSSELLVTRIGPASAMGRLAGALSGIETGKTPLERSMDAFGTQIARYVGVLGVLIVVGGLLADGLARFDQVLMFAVAFAVAIVPEGMPAVVTLVLSFGVQRMARRHAVVRRLSAVEALGAVTVIASDKTGTLTLNRMAVGELKAPDEDEALRALVLANDADHASSAGDPLERGLFEFVQARGTDVAAIRHAHPRISSRPFDTRWKYMRATVVMPGGELKSYVKGGLEVVLEPAVAEWDQHSNEYVPIEELKANDDPRWQAMVRGEWTSHDETPEQFNARIVGALERIIAEHRGGRVAVVCHGGVINGYLAHVLGLREHSFFYPNYTSIHRVAAASTGERSIVTVNETTHLRGSGLPIGLFQR